MAVSFDAQRTQQLMRRHVGERLEAGRLAGVVAGVWVEGTQRLEVCLGSMDPAAGRPMRTDALFRMASMTKPVTGAAVMLQNERGLLPLDEPITRWLPAFAQMQVAVADTDGTVLARHPAQRPITPRMLLTHSAGIGSGPAGDRQLGALPMRRSLEQAVAAYADFALDFQPGASQMYSGQVGMDILARLVELTADMPYPEFLKKELFGPLEMPDTTYSPTDAQQARTVAMTDARDGVLHPVDMPARAGFGGCAPGYPGGGAGLFSTLQDYSHLALMYAGLGEWNGRRILAPHTVQAMATPQLPESFAGLDRHFNWGLSMRVCGQQTPPDAPLPGQPLPQGSFGWSGAYGTHFWIDRRHDLVAVYLSNLLDGGGAGAPTAFEFERDVMAGLAPQA